MHDCNEIVKQIYTHPDINSLISKIHPESLRDDLRQEMAVSLLEQPCDKIASLFAQNNLIRYAIRTCWLMATSKTSSFYYRYKRKELSQAVEYLRLQQGCSFLPSDTHFIHKALNDKQLQTKEDDHEVRVFNKFVELGSSRKVASFYGIPVNHVCNVVNKVRAELKSKACGLN